MKPIGLNSEGAAVEDIQRRLGLLGYSLGPKGIDGIYLEDTAAAVRAFREAEGLPLSDEVDDDCWSALVDASFALGDRTLYLRAPFFHGNDVRKLQTALNVLGFTCGQVDGIFGAHTERALREFQANVGIDPDGIAGSWTFKAIERLHHVWLGKDSLPHSAAQLGFSRAADVLERVEICFAGSDDNARQIASRISNLALATTPYSRASSVESFQNAHPEGALHIEVITVKDPAIKGIPYVVFSDELSLVSRIRTAAKTAAVDNMRIAIGIPADSFIDPEHPTSRELQHVAVTLLDAVCAVYE
ncbi:MAG: peptidoglycan-binding protein [Actinobacteria bacterium]|nr:peptidoglycan-binding protein [Actinomycetota bacterium]